MYLSLIITIDDYDFTGLLTITSPVLDASIFNDLRWRMALISLLELAVFAATMHSLSTSTEEDGVLITRPRRGFRPRKGACAP